jgi:hypothetical protein
MTPAQWLDAGRSFAASESGHQWRIGDWWNAGVPWGKGEEACREAGIEYKTARNCATVCKAFDLSRRRDNLSFNHHAEAAAMADAKERDALLDWAAEPTKDGKRPRPCGQVREEAKRRKARGGPAIEATEPARREQPLGELSAALDLLRLGWRTATIADRLAFMEEIGCHQRKG